MMKSSVDVPDRSSIPAPDDDGATRHLVGMRMASISLAATRGGPVDFRSLPVEALSMPALEQANRASREPRRLGHDSRRTRLHPASLFRDERDDAARTLHAGYRGRYGPARFPSRISAG